MPIFVKAGAIIPSQEVVNYVGEKEIDQIILDIYPERDSHFQLYNDDGKSLDYKNGAFNITNITSLDNSSLTKLTIRSPEGKYSTNPKTYIIRVHSEGDYEEISVNRKKYRISAEGNLVTKKENGILEIKPSKNSEKNIEIILTKVID